MSRRLFINTPEVIFFNSIGKELIQQIIGQKVIYYAISDELTNADALYGEATLKTSFIPVEINALVKYNEPLQTLSHFTVDTVNSIEIYFLLYELTERGISPKIGDFCKYGREYYEIEKLLIPQLIFGQIDNKVQVKAACRIARESQFKIPNNPGKNEP